MRTEWKGCLNFECGNESMIVSETDQNFCEECGEGLQPWPKCACGTALNLKWLCRRLSTRRPPYCRTCGIKLTEAILGPLLSTNLRTMLEQVALALDATRN